MSEIDDEAHAPPGADPEAAPAAVPARRPYSPPRLTVHGTLTELTQGGGFDIFDGISASGSGGDQPPPLFLIPPARD